MIRRPAIMSPSLLPSVHPWPSSLALSLFFHPHPNLRLWLKLDWPAEGYIRPRGCTTNAASHYLLLLDQPNLHSYRLKMVSTRFPTSLHSSGGNIKPTPWINYDFLCIFFVFVEVWNNINKERWERMSSLPVDGVILDIFCGFLDDCSSWWCSFNDAWVLTCC